MVTANLFRALGDPIRLEIVQRLSSGEPYTISTVSTGLGVTRQGARKHLQLLANAKLIKLESKGRDTSVILDNETLKQGKAFIAKLEQQWDTRLKALQQIVDN
ncbi:MAG: metalloregulator ArsR/SmtB family transcription factor [Flavisolibacter sp.]